MTTLDRARGCVLGAAIGDALGHPVEFLSMRALHARFGPRGVQDYALFWERDGTRFAPYTDDTQMAEIVLRVLLAARDEGLDLDAAMTRMARGFIAWAEAPQGGHRAPGNACLAGCRALAAGVHWSEAGGPEAGGCGSVMRAYPFGLVFAADVVKAEAWAVAHSALTHRDPIARAACAAMAVGVARAAVDGSDGRATPGTVVQAMVEAAGRHCAVTAAMLTRAAEDAATGVGPEVTLDRLRAWAAHEAIAAAVYIFVRHADDARAAVLEGANTPGDSDSIATLAGALVGARTGLGTLPARWVTGLERTAELDALAHAVCGAKPAL